MMLASIRGAVVATLCLASAAGAQVRSTRVAIEFPGQLGPALLIGEELRGDLGSATITTGPFGQSEETPPNWMWNVAGHIGAVYGTGSISGVRFEALGKAGVLYRLNTEARVGILGVAALEPRSVGAMIHYEPQRALAVEAGWVHQTRTSRDRAVVGVDVALAFITDLLRGGSTKP